MITAPFDLAYIDNNPVNAIEEFIESKGWLSSRKDDNSLKIYIPDNDMDIEINLEWQEEFSALLIACVIPLEITDKNYEMTTQALEKINQNMWLGHFDLSKKDGFPTFRQTLLLRLIPTGIAVNLASDVFDIAVSECNRFYTTFQFAQAGDIRLHDDLNAAVFETIGKA